MLEVKLGKISQKEIAKRYQIGTDSITRWQRELRERGSLSPKKIEGRKPKISIEEFKKYVDQNGEKDQYKMAAELGISQSGVSRYLRKINYTRKKNRIYTEKGTRKRGKHLSGNSKRFHKRN